MQFQFQSLLRYYYYVFVFLFLVVDIVHAEQQPLEWVIGDGTISEQCLNETNTVYIPITIDQSICYNAERIELFSNNNTYIWNAKCDFSLQYPYNNDINNIQELNISCTEMGGILYYNDTSCIYDELRNEYYNVTVQPFTFDNDDSNGTTTTTTVQHVLCAGISCTDIEKSILQNEICDATIVQDQLISLILQASSSTTSDATTTTMYYYYHSSIIIATTIVMIKMINIILY